MIPRPRFRLPIWAALALVGAAYIARVLMRGGDFLPDLPGDAVALVAIIVGLGAAWWLRRMGASDKSQDHPADERDGEDGTRS